MKKIFLLLTIITIDLGATTKFFLNTNCKFTHNSYSNLDFDNSSSTDTYYKFYHSLDLNFLTILEDKFFFNITFYSFGEMGSVYPFYVSDSRFKWEEDPVYIKNTRTFSPFLAEFYGCYRYNFSESRIKKEVYTDLSLGRKRKQFLEGLVVGDNGIGYDGIFLDFYLDKYFYFETMLSKVGVSRSFIEKKDFFLNSFLIGSRYFKTFDFGVCATFENNDFEYIKRIFYEFFIKRELENYTYFFEYAVQKGSSRDTSLTGSLLFFRAKAFGKSRFFGKSEAEVVWLLSSGGENNVFSPTFSKMYEGEELYGFGNLAKGNVKTLFFDLPDGYSGMSILGFNVKVNPYKKFFSGFEYYLYASPSAPEDRPDPSSVEKTLGAKKAIGLEYGIFFDYQLTQYVDLNLSYSIFTPSKRVYKDKNDSSLKLSFSTQIKF